MDQKLSDAEQALLSQFNEKVLPYLDEIDSDQTFSPHEEEKLIAFAVMQAYGEENKTEFTLGEINNIIGQFFNKEISTENYDQNTPSPYLQEKGIYYMLGEDRYIYEPRTKSKHEIASTPINAYIQKEAKIRNNVITVTYSKYLIEDPYAVLNDASGAQKDTTGVGDYLAGKGKAKNLKRLISAENADKVATFQKDYTLTLEIKNNKISANF